MSVTARVGVVLGSACCCIGCFGILLGFAILTFGGMHGVDVNSVEGTVRAVEPSARRVTVSVVVPQIPESIEGGSRIRAQVPWRSDESLPELGVTVIVYFQNYASEPHSAGPVGEPGPDRIGSVLWDTGLGHVLIGIAVATIGLLALITILEHHRRAARQSV